jgi:arginyl-tRNA--protein-N-Asp/Glu arginylyltransferase
MRGMVVDAGPCPYLPGRSFHAFHPVPASQGIAYRDLMDLRFRRSGDTVYMPICPGCDECRPIRVDAAAFMPREDQRRCRRRNTDLTVSFQPRGIDDERMALYRCYQATVHGKDDEPDPARIAAFLTSDGGVAGGELHARDGHGRLLAVSVVDVFADALSSVYCYHDPDERRRGLGTWMALAELDWCVANHRRWWYLGFLVEGCAKMAYKGRYRPCEVLVDGRWRRRA